MLTIEKNWKSSRKKNPKFKGKNSFQSLLCYKATCEIKTKTKILGSPLWDESASILTVFA